MNKQNTLEEQVLIFLIDFYTDLVNTNDIEEEQKINKRYIKQIIQVVTKAVRKHDRANILEKIEGLDYYEAISEGEDDYGGTHIKKMGDSVLIEEVERILGGSNGK